MRTVSWELARCGLMINTQVMIKIPDMQTHPVVSSEDEVQLSVPIESSSEPAPNAEAVEDAEER